MDTGLLKSESWICADHDTDVAAFRGRSVVEQAFRECSATAPTATCESTAGWLLRPPSSPPAWPPTATGRFRASASEIRRTARVAGRRV